MNNGRLSANSFTQFLAHVRIRSTSRGYGSLPVPRRTNTVYTRGRYKKRTIYQSLTLKPLVDRIFEHHDRWIGRDVRLATHCNIGRRFILSKLAFRSRVIFPHTLPFESCTLRRTPSQVFPLVLDARGRVNTFVGWVADSTIEDYWVDSDFYWFDDSFASSPEECGERFFENTR